MARTKGKFTNNIIAWEGSRPIYETVEHKVKRQGMEKLREEMDRTGYQGVDYEILKHDYMKLMCS